MRRCLARRALPPPARRPARAGAPPPPLANPPPRDAGAPAARRAPLPLSLARARAGAPWVADLERRGHALLLDCPSQWDDALNSQLLAKDAAPPTSGARVSGGGGSGGGGGGAAKDDAAAAAAAPALARALATSSRAAFDRWVRAALSRAARGAGAGALLALPARRRAALARLLLHAASCHHYAVATAWQLPGWAATGHPRNSSGGGGNVGGGGGPPTAWAWPYEEPCVEPLFAALIPQHQMWLITDVLSALWDPAGAG